MGSKKKAATKNYEVRLTKNALQNIDEITGYIAFINQQPLNATKIGQAIFAMLDKISFNPLVFRQCVQLPSKDKIFRQASCYS